MNFTPRHLMFFSITGLFISLIVHLLAVFNIYIVSNIVVLILTAGIIFVWLQSSKYLKLMHEQNETSNPWKMAFDICPAWLKYSIYFLIIYALFNFARTMSFIGGEGYINTNISSDKLRGISGFWLAFYAFGVSIAYAVFVKEKMTNGSEK